MSCAAVISFGTDALERKLEEPLSKAESDKIKWQEVEAEPPGKVVLYRYVVAPHPRVTFANDFSKRLDPQPGMKLLYARTTIDSDREQAQQHEQAHQCLNSLTSHRTLRSLHPAHLGALNISVLQNYDSGLPYSAWSTIVQSGLV